MSDVLQDAEAIQQRAADFRNEGQTVVTIPQDAYDQLAPRLLLIGEYEKILPELIKEIKRLLFDVGLKTRQHANQSLYIGSLQGMLTDFNEIMEWQEEQLATKDEEIKRLQEQLAKWQQTAVEERADHIAAMHVLTGMVPIRSIPATVATVEDHVAGFRERAAKELGLEQDASYIGRLETAYLLAKEESLWANHDVDDIVNSKQRAQAALAKIREGRPS